jgi:hypothetical protein
MLVKLGAFHIFKFTPGVNAWSRAAKLSLFGSRDSIYIYILFLVPDIICKPVHLKIRHKCVYLGEALLDRYERPQELTGA